MTENLHASVSRMAAGLLLFHETNNKSDIRQTADQFATEVVNRVLADLRQQIEAMQAHHIEGFDEWNGINSLRALMHSDYRDCLASVMDLIEGEMR